jgi:SAM-dependent methyltransferase
LARGTTTGLPIEFREMNILNYSDPEKFDFITVGEVIEHLEDPLQLLVKIREMLAPNGRGFISAPTNSPTIDHIYLFREVDEIRDMLRKAGFRITSEEIYAENVDEAKARRLKLPVMFAAFVLPA